MKYIVETLSTFRNVHVVEATSEEDAYLIAANADDNWQEWLGITKLDIRPYSEEIIKHLRSRENYFWEGVSSINDEGHITYANADGEVRVDSTKVR